MCEGNTFMAENARLPNKILYVCSRKTRYEPNIRKYWMQRVLAKQSWQTDLGRALI